MTLTNWVPSITQWAITLAVLVSSHFAYLMIRKFIAHFALRYRITASISKPRLFAFSSIAYMAGLQIAAQFAPLSPHIQQAVDHVVFCINVLLLCNMLKHIAFLGIESSFFQSIPSPTLKQGFIPLLRNLITLLTFSAAAIMVLQHFQYDVFSLLTALGVGSLAFGLASKDTLSHMISGFILIIDRNLRQGDCIQIDSSIGIVKEIGLRSTQILLINGNLLIVPNSDLVNNKLLNLSYPTTDTRGSFFLKIKCGFPLSLVQKLCESIYSTLKGTSSHKPTQAFLISFSEGYQLIEIVFWAKDTRDLKKVSSEYQSKVLERLQAENIPIIGL